MYRKVAQTGFLRTISDHEGIRTRPMRRAESSRWPVGVSLTIALLVSLALWAGVISAAMVLLRL